MLMQEPGTKLESHQWIGVHQVRVVAGPWVVQICAGHIGVPASFSCAGALQARHRTFGSQCVTFPPAVWGYPAPEMYQKLA